MSFKKGHKHTKETKKKISLANKGRKFSYEWKRNLSIAHKGQVSWRKGRKFVDENISKEQRRAYRRAWALRNHDKLRKQSLDYYQATKPRRRVIAKIGYVKNKIKILDKLRFKKYGITGDEFRKIIDKQQTKCPICNRSINKNLSIDHDHNTGKIRGIICNSCNLAIGNAESSPERLRAMANYLEKII
jgi:hypothetical protein